MPEARHIHLVMYDVTDDKRLRKVHKTLRAWGEPVQYSVFRVRGTARELARLRFELARIMTEDDRLLLVKLCQSCACRVVEAGTPLAGWETEVPVCRIIG